MRYASKYDNHFLNIQCGRARFADFADFTRKALRAEGLDPMLAGLLPAFEAAYTIFAEGVKDRTTGSGETQRGTSSTDTVWGQVQNLITELHNTKVLPAYYDKPEELLALYPDQRSGLTQAPLALRMPRLTAYVEALEARAATVGADAGQRARTLLGQYEATYTAKQQANKDTADTIADLGPDAVAVCEQLWAVHLAALWVYRTQTAKARAFFNYGLLPKTSSRSTDEQVPA